MERKHSVRIHATTLAALLVLTLGVLALTSSVARADTECRFFFRMAMAPNVADGYVSAPGEAGSGVHHLMTSSLTNSWAGQCFEVEVGDGAGAGKVYRDIPKLKANDWIYGNFYIRQRKTSYDGYPLDEPPSGETGWLHGIIGGSGGFEFGVVAQGSWQGKLKLRVTGVTPNSTKTSSNSFDFTAKWYRVEYAVKLVTSSVASVTVNLYDSNGTVDTSDDSLSDTIAWTVKTLYETNWTRVWYGLTMASPTVTHAWMVDDADGHERYNDHSLSFSYIDPNMDSTYTWSQSSSLDPYQSSDPQVVTASGGSVSELTSGLRTGPWNYGMTCTKTAGQETAAMDQAIPGTICTSGDAPDYPMHFAGYFWATMGNGTIPSSGTTPICKISSPDGVGFRICAKYVGNSQVEIELQSTTKDGGGNIVVDQYDDSGVINVTSWRKIYYWVDMASDGASWTARLTDDSGTLDNYLSDNNTYTIRSIRYGLDAYDSNDPAQTWYFDDAWTAAGWKSNNY